MSYEMIDIENYGSRSFEERTSVLEPNSIGTTKPLKLCPKYTG